MTVDTRNYVFLGPNGVLEVPRDAGPFLHGDFTTYSGD